MTGYDPSLDFKRLRQQVGVGQVLTAYRLNENLRLRGEYLVGPCPLHGGNNRTAFRANLRRNIWNCFTSCGGGDVVDLTRIIERCSYAQAALHLRHLAQGASPSPQTTCPKPHSATPALGYRPFRRRIPLDPSAPFLQQHKRITAQTASRFEAGIPDQRSTFLRGTIAVRLHDINGQPLGYCGRRLDHDDISRWGKWRFPVSFPKAQILFNAHRALHARASGIVVVECPWAVLRLSQVGFPGAVALLGTTISTRQADWIQQAPEILLLLDGDPAGRAASRSLDQLLNTKTKVRICDLPEDYELEDFTDEELASLLRLLSLKTRRNC